MNILIYGNGAMAKVLYSYARTSLDICGFTVDDECIPENTSKFCGLPLVTFSKVQEKFGPVFHKMIIAVGFIDMNDLRNQKYNEAIKKQFPITSLGKKVIHD